MADTPRYYVELSDKALKQPVSYLAHKGVDRYIIEPTVGCHHHHHHHRMKIGDFGSMLTAGSTRPVVT
jgi:hypothetical protein